MWLFYLLINTSIMRVLFFLLVPLFLLSGCAGNSVEKEYNKNVKFITAKKWKYDEDAIREAAKSALKTNQEEDLMNNALARLQNAYFVFNEDGSMMLDMPDQQLLGTWELSEDSKEFFILIGGTSNLGNRVTSITENQIHLAADAERGAIFPKIFKPAE